MAKRSSPIAPDPATDQRDLGFGGFVTQQSRQRFLNHDGSFNVRRRGLRFWPSLSIYYSLLSLGWGAFFGLVAASYLLLNVLFALLYLLCGPGALVGASRGTPMETFLSAFFFSVQTFATVGYGHIIPVGTAANAIVTVEALVGLFSVALATGLLLAKISRPTTDILFSKNALVAPYQGTLGFMFRIVNERRNQIIELQAQVVMSRFVSEGNRQLRRFFSLQLERERVAFFPLAWTIVHPIDERSPLFGVNEAELQASDAEFLILLTGTDDTFSQTVHARSSYKTHEVVWGARFADMYLPRDDEDGIAIDVRKLDDLEEL